MKNRNINTILIVFTNAILFFTSCNNSSVVATAAEQPTGYKNKPSKIVGTWKWAGSAIDENNNGKPDNNEWKYRDAAKEKEFAAMNISLDGLNLHFNADGTGFVGKAINDSTKFTWEAKGPKDHYTTQNIGDKTKSELYLDENGFLVEKDAGEMTAASEKMKLTTFEMFKNQ